MRKFQFSMTFLSETALNLHSISFAEPVQLDCILMSGWDPGTSPVTINTARLHLHCPWSQIFYSLNELALHYTVHLSMNIYAKFYRDVFPCSKEMNSLLNIYWTGKVQSDNANICMKRIYFSCEFIFS